MRNTRRVEARRALVGVSALLVVAAFAGWGADLHIARASDLDTGTIYYGGGGFSQMNPDGSSKELVGGGLAYDAEPGKLLHDGRWFLQVDEVADEYPDGRPRWELLAVHESGFPVVQLTDGRNADGTFIEPNNRANDGEAPWRIYPRWTDADRLVSYLGIRTSYDAQGTRSVLEGGLYALEVNPSALASHTVVEMDDELVLPMALNSTGVWLWNANYAWSPDATSIVYWVPNDQDLVRGVWRVDAWDGFSDPTLLTENSASDFRWSPDGNWILFNGGLATGIKKIRPDGTDETLIVADPKDQKSRTHFLQDLTWSPSGTHIAYGYYIHDLRKGGYDGDVVRATSSGGGITNLTADTSVQCGYPRWRGSEEAAGPSVAITAPSDGSTVWGNVSLSAIVASDVSVTQVEFFLDGISVGVDDTNPYSLTWDSTTVTDGGQTISATATDSAGATGSDSVSVTVDNVDDAPLVAITAPEAGATVSGLVTIEAEASDDGTVAQVQFLVDGVSIGTDTSRPYQISWDTTAVADGSHTLTAIATDDATQTASDSLVVTVLNSVPSLSVISISPNTMRAGATVDVTVGGTGFATGATLTFENGSGSTPTASGVVVASATAMTARVSVGASGKKGTYTWDVVVTNPGSVTATMPGGFTVVK